MRNKDTDIRIMTLDITEDVCEHVTSTITRNWETKEFRMRLDCPHDGTILRLRAQLDEEWH